MRITGRWRDYVKGIWVLFASRILPAAIIFATRHNSTHRYQSLILQTMADITAAAVHTRTRFPLNLALATFLTLVASVCLWLAAFSTPFIKRIYYLGINRQGGSTKFGTFGYCYGVDDVRCIPRDVGVSLFLPLSLRLLLITRIDPSVDRRRQHASRIFPVST